MPKRPSRIPVYLKTFVGKKSRQIDSSKWPNPIKEEVKKLIQKAAASEEMARTLAKPKNNVPHGLLVEVYANTLFREFNRFLESKNVGEFINKRKPPLPRMGQNWFGTKKDIMHNILGLLDGNNKIPDARKREVLEYLQKNKNKLTNVQLHRVQHYVVGLAILAKHGLL